MMRETDYYAEITKELEEQFNANISANISDCKVYFTHNLVCVNLNKGLNQIIKNNGLTCKDLLSFAANAPAIDIDIFGVAVMGDHFRLMIAEIKRDRPVGLTEYSQLLGYCISSNAQYGLLINVNAGESDELARIIRTQPSITHIIRLLPDKNGAKQETKLAVMRWNHKTETLFYSNLGTLPTLGKMCEDISSGLLADKTADLPINND